MAKSCASGMSAFGGLLRGSRLAGLARPIEARPTPQAAPPKKRTNRANRAEVSRIRPSSQVVHTTPASNHRADYGLKRAMPRPLRSRYITIDALDTVHGFTDYRPGASQALVLSRVRSLNLAPHPIPRPTSCGAAALSPLLGGETPTAPQPGPRALGELVAWVVANPADAEVAALSPRPLTAASAEATLRSMAASSAPATRAQLERVVARFADSRTSRTSRGAPSAAPIATAGASYALPGALHTSPAGVAATAVVPGRLLDRSAHSVAAAGIVALSDMGSRVGGSRALVHRSTKEFVAHSLKIKPATGQINLYLRTPRNTARDRVDRRSAAKHVAAAPPKPSAAVPLYNMIKNALY